MIASCGIFLAGALFAATGLAGFWLILLMGEAIAREIDAYLGISGGWVAERAAADDDAAADEVPGLFHGQSSATETAGCISGSAAEIAGGQA